MCSSYQRIGFKDETIVRIRSESTVPERKPPLEAWFKLNVNAATNVGKRMAGLGAIFRNWKGR